MSKHTGQNQFHGSTGTRGRTPKGGVQNVHERDVIAAMECWCGGPYGHDWPGKSLGAPHPRTLWEKINDALDEWVAKEMRESRDVRTVAESRHEPLDRRQVKKFHKSVVDVMAYIVDECKCRYRMAGNDVMLYPPDGTSRPFKVTANRNPEQNVKILHEQFIRNFGLPPMNPPRSKDPVPDPPRVVATGVARPNPFQQVHEAPVRTEVQVVESDPQPEEAEAVKEPEEWPYAIMEGWSRVTTLTGGEPLPYEERDGVLRCIPCRDNGETWTTTSDKRRSLGGHTRAKHNRADLMTPEVKAKITESRLANMAQRKVTAHDAVLALAEVHGIKITDHSEELKALTDQVNRLTKALEDAEQKAAEALQKMEESQARLALLREALDA